jgi:hypothetical protein
MSLLPPVEGSEYPDQKSMVEAIQAHARGNGYAVTIQWSSNKDGTVYLGYDRGRQYQARYGITDTTRLRNTGTRLTGCPFSIRGAVNNLYSTCFLRQTHYGVGVCAFIDGHTC